MTTTVTLNGIQLNHNMQWVDRNESQQVQQAVTRTLSGNLVVFHRTLTKGEKITLVATEEQGWLQKTVIDSLKSIANTTGGVYPLVIDVDGNIESYNVMFRHNEPPAFSAFQLIHRLNAEDADYYTATIKLITV